MAARSRLVPAAVVLTGVLLSAAMGTTAAASAKDTIGGPLLATHGVVVRPLAGAPALPPASQLPASSWLVADITTGQVLAAKDPHGRYLPASTLKMLTAITLLPRLDPAAVAKLFTAMLVVSANDAADALTQAAGGTRLTLARMNAEARHLQADDTVAKTPSGLDATGESTSAYDLALIARAGLAMPDFRHYISIVKSEMPEAHHKHYQIYTHNELLTTYPGDIGVKNGYTVAAEGTDVQAATRHGQTIVVTLMHANPNFWPMAKDLLNWGFKAIGHVRAVGTLVAPLQPAVTSTPPATAPAAVRTSVALHSGHSSDLRLALVGVAAVIVAGTAATWNRRRRRRRPRYSLPRF
jgi:D-alanyl-D-alanine carboxypeptidase (penicillin-binding protein 5/6)